jgi:hypothetical protein
VVAAWGGLGVVRGAATTGAGNGGWAATVAKVGTAGEAAVSGSGTAFLHLRLYILLAIS